MLVMFIIIVVLCIPVAFLMALPGAIKMQREMMAKKQEEKRLLKAKADREELEVKLLQQQLKERSKL